MKRTQFQKVRLAAQELGSSFPLLPLVGLCVRVHSFVQINKPPRQCLVGDMTPRGRVKRSCDSHWMVMAAATPNNGRDGHAGRRRGGTSGRCLSSSSPSSCMRSACTARQHRGSNTSCQHCLWLIAVVVKAPHHKLQRAIPRIGRRDLQRNMQILPSWEKSDKMKQQRNYKEL